MTELLRAETDRHSWLWSYLVRSAMITFLVEWGGTMFPLGLLNPWMGQFITGPALNIGFALEPNPFISGPALTDAGLGLVGGAIWMLLEALLRYKRKHEVMLYRILRMEARYTLGGCMFGFGLIKILSSEYGPPAQLWPPVLGDLITPFGQMPHWWMFWRWPGTAPTYSQFTGWVEMFGGLAMFWNRTALLGTLLNMASLVNIAVMSSAYFSTFVDMWLPGRRFFLIAFLLYDDWPRLKAFLWQDRSLVPPSPAYGWPKRWMARAAVLAQVLFVLRMSQILNDKFAQNWYHQRPRAALESVYEVEQFTRNGRTVTEAETKDRWWMVAVSGCVASARTFDGKEVEVAITPVTADCGDVPNSEPRTMPQTDTIRFGPAADGSIEISGTVKRDSTRSDTILARLKPVRTEDMPIYDPHWWWTKTTTRVATSER